MIAACDVRRSILSAVLSFMIRRLARQRRWSMLIVGVCVLSTLGNTKAGSAAMQLNRMYLHSQLSG